MKNISRLKINISIYKNSNSDYGSESNQIKGIEVERRWEDEIFNNSMKETIVSKIMA